MNTRDDRPSETTVRAVVAQVAPGTTSQAVLPLAGSFSNHTHLIELTTASGDTDRIVIRRYNPANGHLEQKARVEFKALAMLQDSNIPAPKPLYLDADGSLLGTPGIVTSYVPGQQIMAADDPQGWADAAGTVAELLARVHSMPVDADAQSFLLDANSEVVWFLKSGEVPDYMQAHPDGEIIWSTVHDRLPNVQFEPSTLVHIDYWSGNILWHEGKVSAVVDWEEAAYGDPVYDVAYCRLEYHVCGLPDAADRFLHAYEESRGRPVTNLGFWELTASVRTLYAWDGWMRDPGEMPARFRQFVAGALQRVEV